MKKILSILLLFGLIFWAGCVTSVIDPCANVDCPDECHGNSLWIQKCSNGKCEPYRELEICSAECGCCPNKCLGEDLYSYKSQNGECAKDRLLERYSEECGATKIKTNLLYPYDVWNYYTYYETDPSQTEDTVIAESFYIKNDRPVYIGLKLKSGYGPLSNSVMSNNSGQIYWAKSTLSSLTKDQLSKVSKNKKLINAENISNDGYFTGNLVYMKNNVYFDVRGFDYLFRWNSEEQGYIYLWHPAQYEMYVMQ